MRIDKTGTSCHSTQSSYLDKDGLDPVDTAEVHGDVSKGLLLATPTRYRVEPGDRKRYRRERDCCDNRESQDSSWQHETLYLGLI